MKTVPPPQDIVDLIERFLRNIDAYKTGRYNETQLRREFIDPFFTALGWDVDNRAGYAEAYKDVIHEDAIRIGAATKAPDYCFRIGGTRKFFIEAKKPSIDIKGDPHPAFQLRRYAWSAKLPLSILTDFEEFAVYDCRIRPKKTDRASTARVKYINYTEYAERWDEIESIFSRDAILKGSFDKYAQSAKRKKGTAEVDAAFLAEIECWREILAKNIALRNPDLTNRQLNFAVQKTIDRIIFLRIAEDRGIEHYGELLALCNGRDVYQRLISLFQKADDRYNSGLFHFHQEEDRPEGPDELTPGLTIDDTVLKDIFKTIYYPDSPYEFSVLPAEILGHVYEQFLGKVITLTPAHRARIEEKPEVKKAGGVYYTPAYIVDYIVENTVGKLLESRTIKHFKTRPPRMNPPLTICDPTCGSGSFLLGAYQYLLDWHLKFYTENYPDRWLKSTNPPITETVRAWPAMSSPSTAPNPTPLSSRAQPRDPLNQALPPAAQQLNIKSYKLTVAERKRILLNHIYGVDIDPQAVEVTKLSLLLKVLEGEKSEMLFATQRALPDLANNIKCGNSLIAPDFYQNTQLALFDDEQRFKINAFDWKTEFPQILNTANTGFDAVIGNPPYIFTREQLSGFERAYFSEHFKASWEKHNTFMLFMELMLRLLRSSGMGSFIVPNSWLTIESAKLLRRLFIPHITTLLDLNYTVFRSVSMEPCVFVASSSTASDLVNTFRADSIDAFRSPKLVAVERDRWLGSSARIVFSDRIEASALIDRIVSCSGTIGSLFDVRSGLQAYEKGRGTPPQTAQDVTDHVFDRQQRENDDSHRYLQGKDVLRYCLRWSGMWMQYGPWLSQPRQLCIFQRPRILVREITGSLPQCIHASYTNSDYLNNKSVLNILHPTDDVKELQTLLGVLNSRVISLYYKERAVKSERRIFPKVVIKNLREFPYLSDPAERSRHDNVAALVQTMLALNKALQNARTPDETTTLKRQITATDNQIDEFVYELYNLTEEEIEIVEAATR